MADSQIWIESILVLDYVIFMFFNHYDSSHIVIMYHDIGTFAGGDRAYMYIVVTVNEANPHLKTSLSTIMVDCELENHKNIYKRT